MITAVLLNDTRIDRHHGCTTVIETIDTLCAQNAITITARAPAHHDWRSDTVFCQHLDAADLVIVNGEGTIHHDRPAGANLLAVGPYAAERGKVAALINSTWQANGEQSLRDLSHFDFVSVRESASEAELVAHGHQPRRIPDLALFHQPVIAAARDGMAFGESVQGEKAMALYRAMWAHGGKAVPIMQLPLNPLTLLRWLKRYDSNVLALAKPKHLVDALRATVTDIAKQTSDRDDFSAEIGSSELVVTGRFHMMIFALAARTPMLALQSNTHKIEATLRDAGLASWRAIESADAIDAALLDRAAQWHGDEEASLNAFIENGRKAMRTLFTDIADAAKANASRTQPNG